MNTVIITEKRQRGIFGTIVWWLFLAFNVIMAMWMYLVVTGFNEVVEESEEPMEQAGAVFGSVIGTGMVMGVWVFGIIVLGTLVALSRGKKVTTQITKSDPG